MKEFQPVSFYDAIYTAKTFDVKRDDLIQTKKESNTNRCEECLSINMMPSFKTLLGKIVNCEFIDFDKKNSKQLVFGKLIHAKVNYTLW